MSNLFENGSYAVTIGVSPFIAKPEGTDTVPAAYIITNKTTTIVEGEHRVLGMAIRMAKEMEDILNEELGDSKEAPLSDLPVVA